MSKNTTLENGAGITPAKVDTKLPVKQNPDGFRNFLNSKTNLIRNVAAAHLSPDRITKIVFNSVMKTPRLMDCSMESIFRCVLQSAELGLEPGGATNQAYLVPYSNTCTLIPSYQGLIELAFRSDQISTIRANVVYQGDKFDYEEGLIPLLKHVPAWDAVRDPKMITHAYCVVKMKDGGVLFDVMTRGEVDAIRSRSKASGSGPWTTDFAEMAKKTVTRRCLKYAPKSVEMQKAFAVSDAVDTGDDAPLMEFDFEGELVETPQPQAKTNAIKSLIDEVPVDEVPIDEETGEVLGDKD